MNERQREWVSNAENDWSELDFNLNPLKKIHVLCPALCASWGDQVPWVPGKLDQGSRSEKGNAETRKETY